MTRVQGRTVFKICALIIAKCRITSRCGLFGRADKGNRESAGRRATNSPSRKATQIEMRARMCATSHWQNAGRRLSVKSDEYQGKDRADFEALAAKTRSAFDVSPIESVFPSRSLAFFSRSPLGEASIYFADERDCLEAKRFLRDPGHLAAI